MTLIPSRAVAANHCADERVLELRGVRASRAEQLPYCAKRQILSDTNCPTPQRTDLSQRQGFLGASHILESIRRGMKLVHIGLQIKTVLQSLVAAHVTAVMICQIRLYVRRDDSGGQAPATFDYQRQQTELDWCV